MNDQSMGNLVASGDVATVQAKIQERYGFTPPVKYVQDFIRFVNDMVAGDSGEEEDADTDEFDTDDDGDDDNDISEE